MNDEDDNKISALFCAIIAPLVWFGVPIGIVLRSIWMGIQAGAAMVDRTTYLLAKHRGLLREEPKPKTKEDEE